MNSNLTCPINQLGYGIASINILKGLIDLGHEVALWPISIDRGDTELNKYAQYINQGIINCKKYSKYAPSIRIWHQFDLAQHIGKGSHVGFPFFELDQFTDIEKHNIESQDLVVVTCEWAKDIVLNNTKQDNVCIVPLGVDRTIFNENIRCENLDIPNLINASKTKTIFINIGKWEIRKGHDVLLNIFEKAFTKKDDVELWMVCDNPFIGKENQEWENFYKNSELGNKIRILPRLTNQESLARIMSLAHVGVFPARGEGWNLDALELMSCGKTVIATDYSAHRDFIQEYNLVPIKEKEIAYDGKWFTGQGSWAKIGDNEIDCFVNKLREQHIFITNYRTTYLAEKSIENVKQSKLFTWKESCTQLVNSIV